MKRRGTPRMCSRPGGADGQPAERWDMVWLSDPSVEHGPRDLGDRWCGSRLWPDCTDAHQETTGAATRTFE